MGKMKSSVRGLGVVVLFWGEGLVLCVSICVCVCVGVWVCVILSVCHRGMAMLGSLFCC